jgi:hypothetical protein
MTQLPLSHPLPASPAVPHCNYSLSNLKKKIIANCINVGGDEAFLWFKTASINIKRKRHKMKESVAEAWSVVKWCGYFPLYCSRVATCAA